MLLISGLIGVSGGCTTTRYLALRDVRENPLNVPLALISRQGPRISDRSVSSLQRYGLWDSYQQNRRDCVTSLRGMIDSTDDPELIYALSEMAYVEGKRAERAADTASALNFYGIALSNSYDYLFAEDLVDRRNPYDPQFRRVCEIYNESLEDSLRLISSQHNLRPGQNYSVASRDRTMTVRTQTRGGWNPEEFEKFDFVSDYSIQTLNNRHMTYGLGVPLIAVRKPADITDPKEKFYPEGLSYSVTALMRCTPSRPGGRLGGSTETVLEFYDPLEANQLLLASQWVPLETDLTTPLAYFLQSPEFRSRNRVTEGLLNPAKTQAQQGLFMLEPYDPDRIPVVMVHGLWSSPLTWMDMFNDLRSYPEIRSRYQFWFYLYPSGQPFWLSATQLRRELASMRDTIDPYRHDTSLDQMVLVGHSMGGLVSRMQTIDSGDDFWRIVSDEPPEKLRGPEDARARLVSNLIFKPNQSVRRVVTIGTPHRGSEFANDVTRWLASRVIRLPQMVMATSQSLLQENPDFFRNTKLMTAANAIDSLAPDSPIFPVMLRAQKAPGVKYHNIIGVLENPSFLARRAGPGDGVVDYASAKMDDVESELVVNAEHTLIHTKPTSILEVRRILLEHLHDLSQNDRVARLPETGTAR
ncbi:MAG: hypothetical protein EA381_01625 [Planctomycetaceae bacterium]|nr:MAG: hypothetical protein EA381_01625 [Planctomycetaceae bacterium]